MAKGFNGKRMVSENLIAILKEMDSKGVSISDLADMLEAFTDDEIQPTLTAGDNISISEENVISATDTKYTAGTGINISEDNEISASAGEVWESVIQLTIQSNAVDVRLFTKEEITNSNRDDILYAELNGNIFECFMKSIGTTPKFIVNITVDNNANIVYNQLNYNGTNFTLTSNTTMWAETTRTLIYSHKLN